MTEHKAKIIIEPELSIDEINERIENEFCSSTLSQLSDENLMDDYKECKSVINEIQKLESILDNNSVDKEKQKKIINEYLIQLIKTYCPNVKQKSFFKICVGIYYTTIHIILIMRVLHFHLLLHLDKMMLLMVVLPILLYDKGIHYIHHELTLSSICLMHLYVLALDIVYHL